jgi:hypothetical protein
LLAGRKHGPEQEGGVGACLGFCNAVPRRTAPGT